MNTWLKDTFRAAARCPFNEEMYETRFGPRVEVAMHEQFHALYF